MIVDSSSLIIFAKINKFDVLFKLYGSLIITKAIYNEVVEKGKEINATDYKIIKEFVDNKKITLSLLNERHEILSKSLQNKYSLGLGESEAIALALQQKDKVIIIDEKIARQICRLHNLIPVGSLRILLIAFKKNILTELDVKTSLDEMLKNKFRIGGEIINEFWNIFEKIKKKK